MRARLLAKQGGACALCKSPAVRPCLDHDHSTGAIRGVACSGCNALLGKIENNHKRYGVRNLAAFLQGVAPYLSTHTVNITGYLHNTHKTDDEKRIRRNTKARAARAARSTTD